MSTPTTSAPGSRARLIAGAGLAVVAVGAVAYGLVREAAKSRLADDARAKTAEVQPASVATGATAPLTMVYYFHGETRCDTCLSIESQAAEAVQTMFAEDIAAGRLRFQAVNYDAPEDRHFRDDFGLTFGSVVVSQGTRYENLREVWTLVHKERPEFDAYVVDHVARFMKAAP